MANKTIFVSTLLLTAAAVTAAGAMAIAQEPSSSDGHGDGRSLHGLCNAWKANEQGRINGNASNAPPFVWLQEQANNASSIESFCDEVPHPGNHSHSGPPGRPAHAGRSNGDANTTAHEDDNETVGPSGHGNHTHDGDDNGPGNGGGKGTAEDGKGKGRSKNHGQGNGQGKPEDE